MRLLTKKPIALLLFALVVTACGEASYEYSDDAPLRLDLSEEKLTILQLTDLHLTFGIDHNDQKTFRLIDALVEAGEPDLIVLTGDMTMAPFGPSLFKMLANRIEGYDVPWTFVFGNHDNDHASYSAYLKQIDDYHNLLFKVGPELDEGGYGNFKIETYVDDTPFYHLYLLDSHTEAGGDLEYGWLSPAQVEWYDNHAEADALTGIHSSVFMHIPLMEYLEFSEEKAVDGVMGEGVFHQGVNTGFFESMVTHGVSEAVFVGHDHLNTFSFYHEDILLAYGLASGYSGYGNTAKGGRLIDIDASGNLTSTLIEDSEVGI